MGYWYGPTNLSWVNKKTAAIIGYGNNCIALKL